jgi:hypothetical protein
MPAADSVFYTASILPPRAAGNPSSPSMRWIVEIPTPDFSANSAIDHFRKARAIERRL